MTNNTATLIYHLGKSVNQKLGALDTKMYGPIQPTPPPEKHTISWSDIGIGLMAFIVLIAWIWVWIGRIDAVKNRIMR